MVVLFIIVILGYVACKLGYMGDKFDKKLSSIVVDITCPLLVLSSVMGDELPDRTLILPLLGVGFLTYILLLVFGFGVPRLISKNHDDQGMIGFALMFANVGFIGYPIVSSIFGPKAIFYAALLNMPNTFFIFTAGVMLIKGEYSVKQFNPKVLLSPALIAAAVAALLVGGASIDKATMGQVFSGTILFHILFFITPLAGKVLFNDPQLGEYFRVFLCYGIIAVSLILYAWKKVAADKRRIEEENRQQLAELDAK